MPEIMPGSPKDLPHFIERRQRKPKVLFVCMSKALSGKQFLLNVIHQHSVDPLLMD